MFSKIIVVLFQSDNASLLTAFKYVNLDAPNDFHVNEIATFSTPITFYAADDYFYANNQLFPGTMFDSACSMGIYIDLQVITIFQYGIPVLNERLLRSRIINVDTRYWNCQIINRFPCFWI